MQDSKSNYYIKSKINQLEHLLSQQNKLDFETPKARASVHPQVREGVDFTDILHKVFKRAELNFINVLRTAFTLADPKSVKKTVKLSIFFMLLGSTSVKAVQRTLVKSTPAPKSIKNTVKLIVFFSLLGSWCIKASRKCW